MFYNCGMYGPHIFFYIHLRSLTIRSCMLFTSVGWFQVLVYVSLCIRLPFYIQDLSATEKYVPCLFCCDNRDIIIEGFDYSYAEEIACLQTFFQDDLQANTFPINSVCGRMEIFLPKFLPIPI